MSSPDRRIDRIAFLSIGQTVMGKKLTSFRTRRYSPYSYVRICLPIVKESGNIFLKAHFHRFRHYPPFAQHSRPRRSADSCPRGQSVTSYARLPEPPSSTDAKPPHFYRLYVIEFFSDLQRNERPRLPPSPLVRRDSSSHLIPDVSLKERLQRDLLHLYTRPTPRDALGDPLKRTLLTVWTELPTRERLDTIKQTLRVLHCCSCTNRPSKIP